MFGVSEIKDVFGTMTVAFVIEIIIAIIGIWIAYKKLKDKIIGSYKERQKQKTDIKEALDAVKAVDTLIETCNNIQAGIETNQKKLNERLDKLEERERNALRAKILDMHRIFTNKKMNPMQAWTEMERDAFNDLISDYESLNGNGHIHTVVIINRGVSDVGHTNLLALIHKGCTGCGKHKNCECLCRLLAEFTVIAKLRHLTRSVVV